MREPKYLLLLLLDVVVGMSNKPWCCRSRTLNPRRKKRKRTNKRGSGHHDGQQHRQQRFQVFWRCLINEITRFAPTQHSHVALKITSWKTEWHINNNDCAKNDPKISASYFVPLCPGSTWLLPPKCRSTRTIKYPGNPCAPEWRQEELEAAVCLAQLLLWHPQAQVFISFIITFCIFIERILRLDSVHSYN